MVLDKSTRANIEHVIENVYLEFSDQTNQSSLQRQLAINTDENTCEGGFYAWKEKRWMKGFGAEVGVSSLRLNYPHRFVDQAY